MRYRSGLVAGSLWLSLIVFLGLTGATAVQLWRERSTRRAS
jgi:hypothetical protein